MDKDRFERLVDQEMSNLPEEFLEAIENLEVMVRWRPSRAQLERAGLPRYQTLLGFYEGIPLTERGADYGMAPPDRITIFQEPIEQECDNDAEVAEEVRRVVRHEIAHYFGISDDRLDEIEGRG